MKDELTKTVRYDVCKKTGKKNEQTEIQPQVRTPPHLFCVFHSASIPFFPTPKNFFEI